MTHHFNTEVAKELGIEEAILLENIFFWCQKNKANGKLKAGKPFTYNSVKSFNALFPYMKPSTIYRALKKLEAKGYIITGEFNTNAYDRTKWYCTTEKANAYYESPVIVHEKHEDREESKENQTEADSEIQDESEMQVEQFEPDEKNAYAREVFQIWSNAKLKGAKGFISFLSRDFKLALPKLHESKLHSSEVVQACKNYAAVIELKRKNQTWWKTEYLFFDFAKYESIARFLPENFDIETYRTESEKPKNKSSTRPLEDKNELEEI